MTLAKLCSAVGRGVVLSSVWLLKYQEFRLQVYGPPSVTTSLRIQTNLLLLVKLHVLIWLQEGELSTRKHLTKMLPKTLIPFFIG